MTFENSKAGCCQQPAREVDGYSMSSPPILEHAHVLVNPPHCPRLNIAKNLGLVQQSKATLALHVGLCYSNANQSGRTGSWMARGTMTHRATKTGLRNTPHARAILRAVFVCRKTKEVLVEIVLSGEWLTPSEAANRLGRCSQRVRQMCDEGLLEVIRVPLGRLVSARSVEKLLAEREGVPA